MRKLFVLAFVVLLCGCARFSTRQVDRTFGPTGCLLTETTTGVHALTFWDAKSELAKFSASQTAKTQSTKVGALNAESAGTNAIAVINGLARIAEAVRPTP